jgi:hypothetical protein
MKTQKTRFLISLTLSMAFFFEAHATSKEMTEVRHELEGVTFDVRSPISHPSRPYALSLGDS